MSTIYRPEVDGLRAIAVIPVIFFHAKLFGVTGGFVGVDVFFVISGFLITRLLQDEILAGKFSFFSFWERRARRLLPPIVLVTAVSLVAGAFLLLPMEYKNFGQSVVASTVFASNVYFWLKSGYFAAPADMIPLLHTWSLAVEEQFYVLFPVVLLMCASLKLHHVRYVIIGIGVLSFVTSVWLVEHSPNNAYYLLPSRAWELMIGSFLALTPRSKAFTGWSTDLLVLAGGAAIVGPMMMYSEATPFPGWAALVPCAGTALIIWATERPSGYLVGALSHPAMLQVGRMSYSLYLWHWPVLVLGAAFCNKYIPDLDGVQKSVILALTVLGAWLSLVLVENPIRYRRVLASRKAIFIASGIAFTLLAGAGLTIHLAQGFPQRVPEKVRSIAEVRYQDFCDLSIEIDESTQESDLCSFGSASADARLRIALFGDSHAMHLMDGLNKAGIDTDTQIFSLVRGACPPLMDIDITEDQSRPGCREHNLAAIRLIRSLHVDAVVLAGYWTWNAQDDLLPFQDPAQFDGESSRKLRDGLTATLREIQATGAPVILANEEPRPGGRFRASRYATAVWHGDPSLPGMRRDVYLAGVSRFDTMLQLMEVQPERQIRLEDYFCGTDFCPAVDGTRSLFVDGHHLSASGSLKVAPAFETVFREMTSRVK